MTDGGRGGNILIRSVAPAEAALLAALHAACFETDQLPRQSNAWDEAAMTLFVAGPSTLCLLACLATPEPRPAGFLIARGAVDEAELLTVGVLGEYRERGVGQALLQHAAWTLRASGILRLFLEVDETNAPALALYRSVGAEPAGHRPGYYENGANAAVLRLELES
jgi:ribosomal-protein-alanine N-acetyltransferase